MASKNLVLGGLAFLLLIGGKKKKSKKSEGSDEGISDGADLNGPSGTKPDSESGGGGGGGSGSGSGAAPSNLAKNAIWVSKDCKTVVYGDGTGEAFWKSKGQPVAQKFIAANYNDPYEIARLMILSMASC